VYSSPDLYRRQYDQDYYSEWKIVLRLKQVYTTRLLKQNNDLMNEKLSKSTQRSIQHLGVSARALVL
jgi:hypothetical protein